MQGGPEQRVYRLGPYLRYIILHNTYYTLAHWGRAVASIRSSLPSSYDFGSVLHGQRAPVQRGPEQRAYRLPTLHYTTLYYITLRTSPFGAGYLLSPR